MSHAGLCSLRKRVTEVKESPWRQVQGVSPGGAAPAHCSPGCKCWGGPYSLGEGKEKYRPQETGLAAFVLRVFICFLKSGVLGEVPGEGRNRIFNSFPGVLLYADVSKWVYRIPMAFWSALLVSWICLVLTGLFCYSFPGLHPFWGWPALVAPTGPLLSVSLTRVV